MMNFENKVIEQTIDKLINGEDYRSEIVNAINVQFLDFSLLFFKDIIRAKLDEKNIDINWYKKYFILNKNLETDEIAIYSGMNKKTITNIYGSATKEIVLNTAEKNFDYLSNLINELNENEEDKLNIQLKITYNKISVELSISESLLVINAELCSVTSCLKSEYFCITETIILSEALFFLQKPESKSSACNRSK